MPQLSSPLLLHFEEPEPRIQIIIKAALQKYLEI